MSNNRLSAALEYAKLGLHVFPVPPGEKKSYKSMRFSNGQPWGKTTDDVEIRRDFMRWPNANIGIATGPDSGFWVLEIDTPAGHDVDGFASLRALEQQFKPLPETRMAESPSGSRHYYWKWPKTGTIDNSASKIGQGIDIRGEGGMVLAPPSVKPGVGEYRWINKRPVADAPDWLLSLVVDTNVNAERTSGDSPQANLGLVAAALAVIPNGESVTWSDWNRIGMAIWSATSGHELGFAAFDNWSRKYPGYSEKDTRDRWDSYSTSPPTSIGAGTVFHLAQEAMPGWRQAYEKTLEDNPLPIIRIAGGELSEHATKAEAYLRAAKIEIYQRGGILVRPVVEIVDAAHGRTTSVAQLAVINPVYMRDILNRYIDFQKWVKQQKQWVSIDPPIEVGQTILARQGEWKFPQVSGVITTPTMRADGSLVLEEGYDAATRLLLVDPPAMPDIPDRPTRGEALAALALLEDLLTEFAFADDVARAVALSALITPVVRGAFTVAPMHVARAPVASSGKSFLFDVAATISIGQPMPVMAVGRTEEETEKRLGAKLLSGQPLISIDNINGELYADSLCQIIERPRVDIRILGKSEQITVETRGTTIFCTGNNVVLVGDLTRRSVTVTLDPKMERPELRVFKENPVTKVSDNRGAYVAAALVVCRAYFCAGRPNLAERLASFEGWSDTVRSALIWLGKNDPVESMEVARAEDPEFNILRDVLNAWAHVIGLGYNHRKTLAEIIGIIAERDHGELVWVELNAAIQAAAGQRQPADPRSLGLWTQRKKDRVVGDLRLKNKPDPKGGSLWWVESIKGETREGELTNWYRERAARKAEETTANKSNEDIPF